MPQFIGNFTFKKVIHTGRYRSFEPETHLIKIKHKVVGSIDQLHYLGTARKDEGMFSISLAIKKESTELDPAHFKWIRLKARFDSAKESREWLKKNQKLIQEKYDLYLFDKD